jgi:hypothetical protein
MACAGHEGRSLADVTDPGCADPCMQAALTSDAEQAAGTEAALREAEARAAAAEQQRVQAAQVSWAACHCVCSQSSLLPFRKGCLVLWLRYCAMLCGCPVVARL